MGSRMANTTQRATTEVIDFEFTDMVGFLIRVSQQVHYSLWNASDDVSGLTSPQFAVLHALAHQQPLDQTELGERASLDRSTLANIVTRLSARGFVARTRDVADARRNLVVLTPAGRRAHKRAVRGAYDINERLLEPVSERDRKALVRILHTLVADHREQTDA
ncbi:putative transcriptional regulator [Rhodococcus wratislaviensis NBRC 100605]|uniref:Putative transcriptional regulator n=2 Tax=Rhodococcus wratislaviensis TaxID=44752 RepID=X0REL0_RHOWR|nr:putative transcriptional regulator [Rhodococcus wratislaviensis NBRC 100605]